MVNKTPIVDLPSIDEFIVEPVELPSVDEFLPQEEIVEQYNSMFGKLSTPTKKLIV